MTTAFVYLILLAALLLGLLLLLWVSAIIETAWSTVMDNRINPNQGAAPAERARTSIGYLPPSEVRLSALLHGIHLARCRDCADYQGHPGQRSGICQRIGYRVIAGGRCRHINRRPVEGALEGRPA